MKLLLLALIPFSATTSIFADAWSEVAAGEDLGFSAITSLEEIEDTDVSTNDGTYYVVDTIANLPTQVKPGAVIKIKKQTVNPLDPHQIIIVTSIANTQEGPALITGKDVKRKDGIYHVINIPKTLKNLEFEVLFHMEKNDTKEQLYKYWEQSWTFEVEQPEEGWTF